MEYRSIFLVPRIQHVGCPPLDPGTDVSPDTGGGEGLTRRLYANTIQLVSHPMAPLPQAPLRYNEWQ